MIAGVVTDFEMTRRQNNDFVFKVSLPQIEIVCDPLKNSGERSSAILARVGLKTLREKEKMLVTSIFSFSHNVFKRLLQGR